MSPEASYRDLPRRPDAVPGLWLHQGDLMRAYAADHLETAGLALELPTGTGKTLPGLVFADWVRQLRSVRVAYACPNVLLAKQVAETAVREGVPAVVLVRSHHTWPVADGAQYEGAEAVAIVTYSTIFNSSPKLAAADLLVLDDAHAGAQYVADQYAVDASSGAFITGPVELPPSELDLVAEAVQVEVDGAVIDSATGAAVQGHPARALALAVNDLSGRGIELGPGWLVLTGGMTDAVALATGANVVMRFAHLGSVFVGDV